jgi:hypothetical protein
VTLCHPSQNVSTPPVFDRLLSASLDKAPFHAPGCFTDLDAIGFNEGTIAGAFRRSRNLLLRTEVVAGDARTNLGEVADGADPMADLVVAALSSGAAVIARRFDQDHDGAAEIQRALESRTGHPVFATLLITHA